MRGLDILKLADSTCEQAQNINFKTKKGKQVCHFDLSSAWGNSLRLKDGINLDTEDAYNFGLWLTENFKSDSVVEKEKTEASELTRAVTALEKNSRDD